VVETRLVGKAELTVDYSNFATDDSPAGVAGDDDLR
jgi:hypothetical protein